MIRHTIPSLTKFSDMNVAIVEKIEAICEQKTPDKEELLALVRTRRQLVRTRAPHALRSIRTWATHHLGDRLPPSLVAELDTGIELIEQLNLDAAAKEVAKSVELLVNDLDYVRLELQDAARIACLSSALIEFADALTANRVEELSSHCHGAMADDAVSKVAVHDGDIEDLVPLLTELFHLQGRKLGAPENVTVSRLRALLTEHVYWGDLPGICVATWAATHGHLTTLGDAIRSGIAAKNAEQKRMFKTKTQPYLLN